MHIYPTKQDRPPGKLQGQKTERKLTSLNRSTYKNKINLAILKSTFDVYGDQSPSGRANLFLQHLIPSAKNKNLKLSHHACFLFF
jgi:hypothetical protein